MVILALDVLLARPLAAEREDAVLDVDVDVLLPHSEQPLRPDGTRVQLSARTIEAWYHAYRCGGFQALFPRDRGDRGRSRAIGAEIAEHILRAKRERPRRSIRGSERLGGWENDP